MGVLRDGVLTIWLAWYRYPEVAMHIISLWLIIRLGHFAEEEFACLLFWDRGGGNFKNRKPIEKIPLSISTTK